MKDNLPNGILLREKGKLVGNIHYKRDWNRYRYQRNSFTLPNKYHGYCVKKEQLFTGCY